MILCILMVHGVLLLSLLESPFLFHQESSPKRRTRLLFAHVSFKMRGSSLQEEIDSYKQHLQQARRRLFEISHTGVYNNIRGHSFNGQSSITQNAESSAAV
mmetsp:Transcript_43327/g.66568  ORF Transcript_43327/g.66568 Transcript_43327/m.66568 type:complete len:101 (-) Transcript_43327:2760-3062(-)